LSDFGASVDGFGFMGNTSLPLASPENRLLVSDGGHPFDVEGIDAAWLNECEQLV
jgi:hypothetical protein